MLAQDDAVIFVGAGISMWSGLPSWPDLIGELAEFLESEGLPADSVRREKSRGDLLQAASLGFDLLTKPQTGQFLRRSCRYGIARPHEIHRKIIGLGPRCFITTNYDNLLEIALQTWLPDRPVRGPITNRQLMEIADIVQARSLDFVFKPHGDIQDVESVILTREQYRALLPGGDRHAALESLKMLMATRPVVYLGFSLRDPNFYFIRDLLANTFKGGTRDHYAVMPDTATDEERFWRRNYGIHLVSYPTECGQHGALLKVLDELAPSSSVCASVALDATLSPEELLRLARYADGLTRAPRVEREFPLRVHAHRVAWSRGKTSVDFCHEGQLSETFLVDGPPRAALVGPPGAGKTYALRRAVASLAEQLHDACLAEPLASSSVIVPVYVDLKFYRGDLEQQIEEALPPRLSLDRLSRTCRLKFFVDSFNELPREYLDSGVCVSNIANVLDRYPSATVVLGSRSAYGFDRLDFPTYDLDRIDAEFVSATLNRLGLSLEGDFGRLRESFSRSRFILI
ncbi:USG protein [Labilithrix luteola]|uniref:USG protein n=1 Tax=Labilithrix luteola TaxID=1391654 RepID=A0A0K1PQH5_9BACT|nr:USG protein [Labilithrix luteola]